MNNEIKSIRMPNGRLVHLREWHNGFLAFEGKLDFIVGTYTLDRCESACSDYDEFIIQGLQIRGLQKLPIRPEFVTIHVNDRAFPAANFCEPVRHSWWAETKDGRLLKVRERKEWPQLQLPLYYKASEELHVSVRHREPLACALEADWTVVVLLTGPMLPALPAEAPTVEGTKS